MFDVEQLALLMRCALVTMCNEQFWCPVVDFQRNIFPTLWTSSMVHGMYQVWNVKCSVFVKCYIFLFFVWKWYFYDKTLLSVKCDTHFVTERNACVWQILLLLQPWIAAEICLWKSTSSSVFRSIQMARRCWNLNEVCNSRICSSHLIQRLHENISWSTRISESELTLVCESC